MTEVIDLSELKNFLMLKSDSQDSVLSLIIKNTVNALRFKLGLKADSAFPMELSYIAFEVCVRRYNRLKNEGMTSYSQQGESISFQTNDFDDFTDDIDTWKRENNIGRPRGKFINPFVRR